MIYYATIQLLQYLLPFVTFPYLTRILGPANFGRGYIHWIM
ncbi:MAG: oligosaccharide flippase family protein [Methanobacteriales archaeon]